MKRLVLSFLAGLLLLVQCVPVFAADASYQVGPDVFAEAYCVMDADTGDVICGHNAMGKYYPASITKILTALVVIENVKDLNETMTFSGEALYTITPSHSTLTPTAQVGEKMSVWSALCGLFLSSANECGNGLAEHVAGSMEAFAELMNEKAEEIGAVSSHFMNAHGFHHSKHYTNAYDMCLIMREALKNETFRSLASKKNYTIPATNLTGARPLAMGHQMVVGNIPYEGVYAGKTGWTPYAGRTLVTAAEYKGRNIIITIMRSDDQNHYSDTQILLDYVYAVIDGQEEWNWEECGETVWAAANVNLRGKATERCNASGSLPKGETAVCLAEYADWCRVEYKGKTYYAAGAYLTHRDPSLPPESESESETEEVPVSSEETEETTEPATEGALPVEDPEKKDGGVLGIIGIVTGVLILLAGGGYFGYRRYKIYKRRKRYRRFR